MTGAIVCLALSAVIFVGSLLVKGLASACPKCGRNNAMRENSRILIEVSHESVDTVRYVRNPGCPRYEGGRETVPVTRTVFRCTDRCRFCGYEREIRREQIHRS